MKTENKIKMKTGILFSGGKDSCYAAFLAKKEGYEISCLIAIESQNKESYMFHTPFIDKVFLQASLMNIPLVYLKTKGEKEKELSDLEKAIKIAIKKYKINGIITGAMESIYQASRVQKICNKLNIECFNPLWQKNAYVHWKDLLKNNFKVIIASVSADGLDKKWIGKEAETFVTFCPLFKAKII